MINKGLLKTGSAFIQSHRSPPSWKHRRNPEETGGLCVEDQGQEIHSQALHGCPQQKSHTLGEPWDLYLV